MHQPRLLALCLAGLLATGLLTHGRSPQADTAPPASPLRLIPAEADLLFEVKDPRHLVDVLGRMDVLGRLMALDAVQEQLTSTNARRGRQLLAYFEKALGAKWPDLLDRLAGGGVAVGLKVGPGNQPLVMVIQGKDEKLMEKFVEHAVLVLEGELARQESRDTVQKGDYKGITGYSVGKGFFLSRVGAALVFSNRKEAIGKALDLHLDKDKPSLADNKGVINSAKLLPRDYLARAWLNMKPIQDSPQGKELYKTPRDNGQLTILFGAYLDLLGRTPYITSALSEKKDGLFLTVRAPAGTDGMGADRELHLPPEGQPGSRPLLEPKGVLYSSSFYMDVSRIWTDRARLFPKVQADGITEFDKNSGRFLAGIRLSTMLESAGPYHRIVVVNQSKAGYKKEPRTRIPSFAFISELKQPEKFGKSMDTLLRTAALFTTQQFKLKLAEEKHNDQTIVGYRFDEKEEMKQDTDDVRFNFSPCFVRVGNQFVFCSTIELCRELVDLLSAEQKSPGKSLPGAVDRYYAAGLADLLRGQEDSLILQTILDRATPPLEAKKQVEQLIELTRSLGATTTQVRFGGKQMRYDIHIRLGKK